jgi:alcohol dehydrogenase (cytochrome c)
MNLFKIGQSQDEGGNNYWSASFSQRTRLLYIPSRPTCNEMTMTPDLLRNPTGAMLGGGIRLLERTESEIVVADPFTGEVRNRVRASYPNFSAALTTAGGLLFTGLGDGTFVAYDDVSLEPLWKINVGVGINAPPMTFETGGRQRQTIPRDHDRPEPGFEAPDHADPRASRNSKPDHAVCVRIVRAR